MHPDRKWEQYLRHGLLRLGMKIRDFVHAVLTGTGLNGRMNSARHTSPARVYEEEAFRYLLDSESRRSKRSGHCCQVLLVFRADAEGAVLPMEPAVAKMVVAVLCRTLRDTDYIGWYRDGRVVGGGPDAVGKRFFGRWELAPSDEPDDHFPVQTRTARPSACAGSSVCTA